MNGNKALLDSNVIIDASKGLVSIQEIVENYDYLYTSIICYIEILGYNFVSDDEKKLILNVLKSIETIDIGKEIADVAVEYRKIKKIKLPDALVLATGKILKADLITSNISDFQNIDDSVSIIKPQYV